MPDQPRPAKRAFVTVADQEWELVSTDKLTFPETRELKKASGGMSLRQVQEGIEGADPDAWFGWLYVSIRRSWPTLTITELENAIAGAKMVAIIESVRAEAPEVADPDPPAQPPPSAADETRNGSGSGETTQPLSTLATSGPLT